MSLTEPYAGTGLVRQPAPTAALKVGLGQSSTGSTCRLYGICKLQNPRGSSRRATDKKPEMLVPNCIGLYGRKAVARP